VDAFGYKRNDLSSDLNIAKILAASPSTIGGNTTTTFTIPYGIIDEGSYESLDNFFNYGRMIVQSVEHPVISADFLPSFVTVYGNHTGVPINSEFRLYDDDDYGLDAPPLPRLDLVNDLMKSFFKPSFIEVIDSGGMNLDKIIPFKKNDDLQSVSLVNSKKDLTERDGIWICPLTTAYQYNYAEDWDPLDEEPTFGGTRPFGNNDRSTVFVETCRDHYDQSFRVVEQGGTPEIGIEARKDLKNYITATASHEMGHQPNGVSGLDHHDEGGLMAGGTSGIDPEIPEKESFSPKSIQRFRKTHNWSK
jgi:hypothetical protein